MVFQHVSRCFSMFQPFFRVAQISGLNLTTIFKPPSLRHVANEAIEMREDVQMWLSKQ